MKIGERIQEIRQARGYSQDAIANELGISQVSYSRIERGETDVNFSRLEKIAKILKVEIWAFFQPDKAIIIVGDVGENSSACNNVNSHIQPSDFIEERQALHKHIQNLEQQVQHLQEENRGFRKLLEKALGS